MKVSEKIRAAIAQVAAAGASVDAAKAARAGAHSDAEASEAYGRACDNFTRAKDGLRVMLDDLARSNALLDMETRVRSLATDVLTAALMPLFDDLASLQAAVAGTKFFKRGLGLSATRVALDGEKSTPDYLDRLADMAQAFEDLEEELLEIQGRTGTATVFSGGQQTSIHGIASAPEGGEPPRC